MRLKRFRMLADKIGISPNQLGVVTFGALSGFVGLISAWLDWSEMRDSGLVGMLTAVLICLLMVLRVIGIKTASIRRDILRHGQQHASVARRIEQNTGLSATAPSSGTGASTVGNSLGHSGSYFGVGPEYEYAWRASQNLSAFETFALRTKSIAMRDVFARVASGLQFNYEDLVRLARTSHAVRMDNMPSVVKNWRPKGLLTLARVVANQRLVDNDAATAILLFGLCIRVFGAQELGKTDRWLFLEALNDEGRTDEAEEWLKEFRPEGKDPVQAGLFKANLVQEPEEGSQGWNSWLAHVNAVLGADGLTPISLSAGKGMPLDRIVSAENQLTDQSETNLPLVTVIVPTHNGSDLIETALTSLQSQTWKNIEILVVDDCSQSAHVKRLRELCASYRNVTLLEQGINSGAYVARNLALDHARGEFVTVHDDDDWSHPDKIRRQAMALVQEPAMIANMSRHTRVTEGLKFMRVSNNPSFSQPNYSSIMFRRSVLTKIGKWDSVNRGADAEFRDRIQNVFGTPVAIIGAVPMSFTRTRKGSLTYSELDRGYIDSARLVYLDSYTQAHQRGIAAGKSNERQFPAPLDLLPGFHGQHKGDFDVVFATDYRFPGGTTSLTLGEIRIAAGMGLRVGILQLDSPLNKPGTRLDPAMLDLLLDGSASLLRVRDAYHANLLLIRHPSVVQFLDNISSPAIVDVCLLVANTAPVIDGGAGNVYDLEQCVRNVNKCFSVASTVVPESAVTRRLVQEVAGQVDVSDFNWPGFIQMRSEIPRKAGTNRPVVGRHSRDNRLKWPDTLNDFMSAYYQPELFDTHILGGMDSIAASVPKDVLREVRVTVFGGAEVRDYLREVDFWVYFHSERTIESFGMAAVEAMEAGLVLILPEYMSATFGVGAVYARPSEVPSVVTRYWSDPELYEDQSQRAREYVREHYSQSAHQHRLASALGISGDDRVSTV